MRAAAPRDTCKHASTKRRNKAFDRHTPCNDTRSCDASPWRAPGVPGGCDIALSRADIASSWQRRSRQSDELSICAGGARWDCRSDDRTRRRPPPGGARCACGRRGRAFERTFRGNVCSGRRPTKENCREGSFPASHVLYNTSEKLKTLISICRIIFKVVII